ncbi:hypothetical protein BN946_scf184751.g4 [Trametes cinnabarina]|uniref:Uncharacterized protein n=1 Tax=Pycnoporus cinnabarinus TaxID=5643 RepID=A0A060SP79_PYCCI|nr:hypothetical protein BN946_scf184751.g4 [Trametes cinnabarina]
MWTTSEASTLPADQAMDAQTVTAPRQGDHSNGPSSSTLIPDATPSTAPHVAMSAKVAGKKVAIWPPPPPENGVKSKPKDLCARIWAAQNLSGTKKDFDEWYKGISQSAQVKYMKNSPAM